MTSRLNLILPVPQMSAEIFNMESMTDRHLCIGTQFFPETDHPCRQDMCPASGMDSSVLIIPPFRNSAFRSVRYPPPVQKYLRPFIRTEPERQYFLCFQCKPASVYRNIRFIQSLRRRHPKIHPQYLFCILVFQKKLSPV